ncbi:MAG: hypothetical protein IPK80_01455 [Nannocystis sp.]|nr:hypothetical protein [Nannocystis sp.]
MSVTFQEVAVIAGAGFSFVAGLPLTRDLFHAKPYTGSEAANERSLRVLETWQQWHAQHPDQGPEQFLTAVNQMHVSQVLWHEVVEFVAAVLATPRGEDRPQTKTPRYAARITNPVRSAVHVDFWAAVLKKFTLKMVVTTNYDLLIERGLRTKPTMRPTRPGIHYGGISRPQTLKGDKQPFSVHKSGQFETLAGSIPLYKLHGSLNWSFENDCLAMYQDARPAFRGGGTAAIIPPLTEKVTPDWLRSVWDQCENQLMSCPNWIVAGYSLPPYDIALSQLFQRAGGGVKNVWLIDPFAAGVIESRWKAAAPNARVVCLPGVSEALLDSPFV